MTTASPIKVSAGDRKVLRTLASDPAEIAALPVRAEKARLWTQLNDLASKRPMVWINEICWNEMNVADELTLRCEGQWARAQEGGLRRELYQWRHLRGDMIVDDFLTCPLSVTSTGFGISEDVDVVKTDETNPVVSRHFNVQITDVLNPWTARWIFCGALRTCARFRSARGVNWSGLFQKSGQTMS